jgi:uncharacterized protein YjbI with pentapeptide repeats
VTDDAKPDRAAAFVAKAKDLDALRAAVIDAAGVGAGLWISYLFVLLYLLIAAGGITHRDLLFENPIKLPFLSVELPLVGFFVLGPLLFLIVHAYVLVHFVLLADKVGVFHAELAAQVGDEDVRTRLRRQLPSNIFVQFLAGPREVRTGVIGALLRLIAQISLVVAPLALLVFILFQFLPHHNEPIAWWQRIAVVLDLALLWTVWPSIARGEMTFIWRRDFRHGQVAATAVASVALIALVFVVATFPDEWLDRNPLTVRFIPSKGPHDAARRLSLHEFLLGGDVDFVARKPTSLWSNRLVVPGIEAPDNASFRGRRLEGAVLIDAKLRKVDFTAANLKGAAFDRADLREAKFECAAGKPRVKGQSAGKDEAEKVCTQLEGATLAYARLNGAILDEADLVDAALSEARLQGASLNRTQLQGANLQGAWLQGANINDGHLQGANLENAHLQGATLDGAELLGAELKRAQLDGAILDRAQLDGASLFGARLTGATLYLANLRGAQLSGADLRGSQFDSTQLQGADLRTTHLEAATFDRVVVWRARLSGEGVARVIAPETTRSFVTNCSDNRTVCEWTTKEFGQLKWLIEKISDPRTRSYALDRISVLDPDKPLADETKMAAVWTELARAPPQGTPPEKLFEEIGCAADGAPYVIRSLLVSLRYRFGRDSPASAALAAVFLNEAKCAGAKGLSDEEKAKLREILDSAPSSPGAAVATPKP